MSTDKCPYCGASVISEGPDFMTFACGTVIDGEEILQGTDCTD